MDRYTAMQVFRQVAMLNSFAAAGKRLGLSAPAISKNIAQLEAHLGVRLINRSTRRMALTEEGRIYLAHLSRGLDALDDAEQALDPMRATPSGLLRVSAPLTLALTSLSPAIPEFMARYPELTLDLDLNDRRVDIIGDGFDLAIRGSGHAGLEDSGLIARKLMDMHYVLCAAPGYLKAHGEPTSPTDLAQHVCLRFSLSGQADFWTFRRNGKTLSVPVLARYSSSSSLALRDALRAGLGLSLIPQVYVADDLRAGTLRAVMPDWQVDPSEIHAVYPSRQYLSLKVKVFLDFLGQVFGSP